MRAAIYCRVSTEDQEREGTSLDSQREACLKKMRDSRSEEQTQTPPYVTSVEITPEDERARIVSEEKERRELYELGLKVFFPESSQSIRANLVSTDDTDHALNKFLELRQDDFYECYLTKSLPPLKLTSTTYEIQMFVDHDCGRKDRDGEALIKPGGRRAYFRAIRAFFNWAYSPASELGLEPSKNPVTWVKPPKPDEKIMPAQDEESLEVLLSYVNNAKDRAILSTLIDSGGRLSEVTNIHEADILWDKHVIKAIAKGNREVLMPFSAATGTLLRGWFTEYTPNGGSIWDINKNGIVSMLRRLERATSIKCNAHTFRRGFASILRRNGVDSLDIMKLGHWKSLRMVQKYTESVDFEDSQKRYKAPTKRLAVTDGLQKSGVVPRPRIELGTRGFSVRCSTD